MRKLFLLPILCLFAGPARAQWQTATYALKGGWNAIYLHGDATHALPDDLFPNSGPTAGVQEIWRWNPESNPVQFTRSPLLPSGGTPEWNVWKRGLPAESNLSLMSGQTAYLVKCSGTAATSHAVSIVQRALAPTALWVRSGANLLGFPSATTPAFPSFSTYFQAFPAAISANAKVYKYVGGGLGPANPLQIFSPTTEPLDRNKAYWFEAEVVGNFFAPLDISLSRDSGIDFGRTGSVINARLRNTTAANMAITFTPVASIAAPAGQDAITGPVPLTRRVLDGNGWTETAIPAGGFTEVIGANSTVELSFGLNRAEMNGTSNALYANLLRLTDSGNLFDISLPVSARAASLAGLWIGDARLTNVSSQVQSTATAKAVLTNGALTGIELTGGGFGYDAIPELEIASPDGVPAAATASISPGLRATASSSVSDGAVTRIFLTAAGSGYAGAPAVTVAPPAAGTPATATATVTDGILDGISITDGGSGYTSAPAITIGVPGGVVSGLTLTNPGSGYAMEPVVMISAPETGLAATAKASVKNGILTGLAVTGQGSGYTSAPLVTLGAPSSSVVQAEATPAISGGSLTVISVTVPGAGYFSIPDITVAPPPSGNTALAAAQVANGIVTGITVISPGSGYTEAPVITIGPPPERVAATATAVIQGGKVTGFTITRAGNGYLAAPAITIPAPVPPGTATARTPPLRMILHVADGGTARLLSQVFVGKLLNGLPGLSTGEAGLSVADKRTASRFVSAHLPLDRVLASGSGSVGIGQTLVRTVSIPFDDETNPFVHRYHPDHDNKDARGGVLSAGVESYGISRTLSFHFTAVPPAGESATGWGTSSIGGNYTEVIKGLHKQDLTVSGTFVLRRASESGGILIP